MSTEEHSSSFDNILILTVVNTITSALTMGISDGIKKIIEYIQIWYALIREKILEWRYGKLCKFTRASTRQDKSIPVVSKYFFDYLEKEHGFNIRSYTDSNQKIVGNEHYIGNEYIGATFDVEKVESVRDLWYNSTFTFYSRLHTNDDFVKLCEDLLDKSTDKVKERAIISQLNSDYDDYLYYLEENQNAPYATDICEKIEHIIKENTNANILLHGPPGTGKTSIIKYLADKMEAILILCHFRNFDNIHMFRRYLAKTEFYAIDSKSGREVNITPKRRFYVFEDFDTMLPSKFWNNGNDDGDEDDMMKSKKSKKTKKNTPNIKKMLNIKEDELEREADFIPPEFDGDSDHSDDEGDEKKGSRDDSGNGLLELCTMISDEPFTAFKYSDLLNLLDGIIRNTGAYIFFTTNHVSRIDSAFYRPGRMHLKLYVGELNAQQIVKFIKDKYKTTVSSTSIKRTTTLAELYGIYSITKKSSKFIERLNNCYYPKLGMKQ